METTDTAKGAELSSTPESPQLVAELTQTLAKGKKPLSTTGADFQSMVSELKRHYAFSEKPGEESESSSLTLDAIETTFQFAPAATDVDYKWMYVEPLLNQAANLLDRCLMTRNERDELAIQKFSLERDLEEFFGSYAIYNDEIDAGLYTVPYERALYEALAENEEQTYVDAARKEIKQVIDRIANTSSYWHLESLTICLSQSSSRTTKL
jgi:hypothetical protein